MRLNLGCGPIYLDGYVNIDNRSQFPSAKVDMEADFHELTWDENTCDEIICSHIAPYIKGGQESDTETEPNEMRILLKRWYSWLKPGGRLIMETSNLKELAKFILETDDPWDLNSSKGCKSLFGWDNTYGHKWSYCPETLIPIFEDAGFKDIELGDGYFHAGPRNFLLVGTK